MSPIKDGGTFSKGFSWQMRENFWEAILLRSCSACGINHQIIMPRAGEFSLRGASEDCLEVCFVVLVVRENYVCCFLIFVIFMGFGGAEVGDVVKSLFGGWQCKPQKGGTILMGKEGWGSDYM